MQLQNFSVNDGEGIRTNIFMAGCPLRCAWCANPEGQTCENALTYYEETEDVLKVIRRQAVFYRHSGGGVTFSGGEPTAQPAFLKELTDILYDEGFSLAIETCGQFSFDEMKPILKKMDLVFIDLKQMNAEKHRQFTGVDNTCILQNICKIYEHGIPMVVRIPAVVGVNGTEAEMRAAFAFLAEHTPGVRIEILAYHTYGEGKYKELGMELPDPSFGTPKETALEQWKVLACEYGLQVVSYR